MISGMTRIPASLSPLRAPRYCPCGWRSSPRPGCSRRCSRWESTRNTPSQAAVSSILPSLTSLRCMCSLPAEGAAAAPPRRFHGPCRASSPRRRGAPCPCSAARGCPPAVTTWPLRKRASLYLSLMICVMSWQRTWPTASSVSNAASFQHSFSISSAGLHAALPAPPRQKCPRSASRICRSRA